MSAFIVSEETMRVIVNGIEDAKRRAHWVPFRWRNMEAKQIGQELFNLNALAVNGRYKENNPAPAFDHRPSILYVSPVALYKALQCLAYQCAEDPATKHSTYKDLENCVANLAEHIVQSMPEYDRAPWDSSEQASQVSR